MYNVSEHDEKRILVTGAAGFIGYHLTKRLLESGLCVFGADNINGYYDPSLKRARLSGLTAYERFTFLEGDLSDDSFAEQLFAQAKPDVVVHLAAQAGVRYSIENPRAYIESNVVGFFNVLEQVRHHPVSHFLYASSSSVYGNRDKTPFSVEDRVDKPVSLYAATKKSNELFAYTYSHLYGVPATGLRFFTVYGPFGRPDMAYFSFTKAILEEKPIDVYNGGDMLRDFTYIDDVTACLSDMLFSPPKPDETGAPNAVYNIGNNNPIKLIDFIGAIEHALGKKATLNMLPMQAGDVGKTYADIESTRRDFGFAPKTQLQDGIQQFVNWYLTYYNKK